MSNTVKHHKLTTQITFLQSGFRLFNLTRSAAPQNLVAEEKTDSIAKFYKHYLQMLTYFPAEVLTPLKRQKS